MSYVFLSYSSTDRLFVDRLASDLRELGHEVWMDIISIEIGDNITERIQKGIKDCEFLILVASRASMKSNWVGIEWITKYWKDIKTGSSNVLPILGPTNPLYNW